MALTSALRKSAAVRACAASLRHLSTAHRAAEPGFLTHDTMNAYLKSAQYAVRGEIVLRALSHGSALARGESRPFKQLTFCNIGNPHELGQKPITFARQVFAAVNYPALLDAPGVLPGDVAARAREYLRCIPGGTGAYSNSQGIETIRQEVAQFISERDGHAAHAADIFLTDGASPAVQMLLRASIRDKRDTVLIPTPQYPLYSASLALYGGEQAGYLLDEEGGWALQHKELERAIGEASGKGKHVRAIAVINPGNPTGNCLSRDNIAEVLKFAARHKLMVLADEVYQDNVWVAEEKPFVSFKQVACELGLVDAKATNVNKGVQLASFHSTSKGFTGECGRRGGYVELCGFDDAVRAELYKLASISLCSNVGGQLMMGLMVKPPKKGDESYDLYAKEKDDILVSLKRRAVKLVAALRKLEGVTCEAPEGALYVFPQIRLPTRAVKAAAAAGKAPDAFYCLSLLDETGIVVVPGSGFGQKPGTYHFRSTILPSEEAIDGVIKRMTDFHAHFMAKYKD